MNYLSLFSGIEAASIAWEDLGWNPVGFAEIESFPSEVLRQRFPNVQNFGNVTEFKEWKINEKPNIIIGGSPCQSFSIAGLRKGLDDPRGDLALTYLAIIRHHQPKWIIWENVPGVLSSNKGRDFGIFLGALAELGYGFAYRVLDSQFIRTHKFPKAVPQRRRRVFVVGHLTDFRSAAAVLFDTQSLPGNSSPLRRQGQEVATLTAAGIECSDTVSPTVTSKWSKGSGEPAGGKSETGNLLIEGKWWDGDNIAGTLTTRCHSQSMPDKGNFAAIIEMAKQDPSIIFATQNPVAGTLDASYHKGAGMRGGIEREFIGVINPELNVRRLTPLECERLQGFPDNWTQIEWKGKAKEQCPVGLRYKAIGNSMAVNVIEWLGRRIQMVEEITNNNGQTNQT